MFLQCFFCRYLPQITRVRDEPDMALRLIPALFQLYTHRIVGHRFDILAEQPVAGSIVLPDPQAGDLAVLAGRQVRCRAGLQRIRRTGCYRIGFQRAVFRKRDAACHRCSAGQHVQPEAGIHFLQGMRRNIVFLHFRLRTTAPDPQKQPHKQSSLTYYFHCISFFYIFCFNYYLI